MRFSEVRSITGASGASGVAKVPTSKVPVYGSLTLPAAVVSSRLRRPATATRTSTRSAGANALTNVGLYATASGAQNNYAAIFNEGNVGIGKDDKNYSSGVEIV